MASTIARSSPVRIRSARRAAAQQQADGLDEHRLAGAGLAGQDVERLFKLDRQTELDDREIPDAER